jgi:hypothetical protein
MGRPVKGAVLWNRRRSHACLPVSTQVYYSWDDRLELIRSVFQKWHFLCLFYPRSRTYASYHIMDHSWILTFDGSCHQKIDLSQINQLMRKCGNGNVILN